MNLDDEVPVFEYKIVCHESVVQFEKEITKHLNDNWKTHGQLLIPTDADGNQEYVRELVRVSWVSPNVAPTPNSKRAKSKAVPYKRTPSKAKR